MVIFPVSTVIFEYTNRFCPKDKSRFQKDILILICKIKNALYGDIFFFPERFALNEDEKKQLDLLTERYMKNEPISKIINKKAFWMHDFFVNEDVLDPRPETELIIEAALEIFNFEEHLKILDIGTGSGCILLSLLTEFRNSSGIGIDISKKAIEVAEINRKNQENDRAAFLAEGFEEYFSKHFEKFDLVVTNPPYIKTADIEKLDENVKNFDPISALDGGEDGLKFYGDLAPLVKKILNPNGFFITEIGYGQAKDVVKILEENHFFMENLLNDLSGIERVIVARNICLNENDSDRN